MTQCHWAIRSRLCKVMLCHNVWSIGPKFWYMTQCHWEIRSRLCKVMLCHNVWPISPKCLVYDTVSLGNSIPTFRSNVVSHLQGSKHSRIHGTFGISRFEDQDNRLLQNVRNHTLILFSNTAQRSDFALLHVSATYCSHHQGAIIL